MADAYGSVSKRSPYGGPPGGGAAGSRRWTDATHMALSVVEMLLARGTIDPDALVKALALRHADDPDRGDARGAAEVLDGVLAGEPWSRLAPALACKPPGAQDVVGAIVGALSALLDPRIPPEWLRLREPLPSALEA